MILYAQVSCQGNREYNEDRVKICRKTAILQQLKIMTKEYR